MQNIISRAAGMARQIVESAPLTGGVMARRIAAGLVGLVGLAEPAVAGQMLYVDNVATNPPLGNSSQSVVSLSGTVDGQAVGPENAYAVEIVLTVNPGTAADPSTEYQLPVWCVDIFHNISVPSSGETFSIGSLSTDNDNTNASNLTATQIQEIADLANYGDNLMQNSPSALNAALVQSSIWTVEYNGGPNNNMFTVTSSYFTATDIQNTINAAETNYAGAGAGQLESSNGVQNEAFATPAPAIGHGLVPFVAVGGLLFATQIFDRRRRRPSAVPPSEAGMRKWLR